MNRTPNRSSNRQKIGQFPIKPRYFFHIQDGTKTVWDREGVELKNLDEVREEAMQSAREIMNEQVLKGEAPKERVFIVEDEKGETVLTFPFKLALTQD